MRYSRDILMWDSAGMDGSKAGWKEVDQEWKKVEQELVG